MKDEDEKRPVITVVAEITEDKIEKLNRIVPWLDGLGINSYGGIKTLGRRVTESGWRKPFIVTEYGPRGAWEAKQTAWNTSVEPTSSQKAAQYGSGFDAISTHPLCVGTLAFIWGWKREPTPTWYGMFLNDGSRLGAVDALQERWTGKVPQRRAPLIRPLAWPSDPGHVAPGSSVTVKADVVSEEPKRLTYVWSVIKEADYKTDRAEAARLIPQDGESVTFTVPEEAGAYRLSVVVKSSRRSAAAANVGFKVIGIEDRGKKIERRRARSRK